MKPWIKKAAALAVCLLMLAAMIPFGAFSTSALDYSNTTFTIASVSDWEDIAAYSEANPSARFTGKTIKLTDNVDFDGATISTLFANNFEGTFDGQGYTLSNFVTTKGAVIANVTNAGSVIKNVKINGTVEYNTYHTDGTNGWQVWAGMIVNRMDAGTVTDVSVAGSITSNAYNVGAVAGVVTLADGVSVTIANVNTSATVHNNRTRISVGWHCAGGVVGNVETFGHNSNLLIQNINMSGTVTRDLGPAGGIVGSIYDKDGSAALYTGGTITIENCQMTGTVTSGTGSAGNGAGGIVGAFGAFKRETNDYTAFDGTLNISNCAVSGTVQNTNTTSEEPLAVGGVIGSMAYGDATVNVDHCLISANFGAHSLTATNGKGAGTILGAAASQTMSSLNVNNCVSTADGAMIGHAIAREGKYAAWLALNGKQQTAVAAENTFAAWYYTNSITDHSVVTVSVSAAEAMVKKNAAGFVLRVGGQITALGVQDNVDNGAVLSSDETFAVRFIAVSHVTNVSSAKMTVVVRDAKSGEAYKKYEKACNLYDALKAYDVDGKQMAYYKATDFGANKFLALTIGGIPAGSVDYTFDFTPSYTTADGLVVTGETVSITYDKNGQYIKAKESFDALSLPKGPSVRIMSSNILVVDHEQTDYTNFLSDHEQRLANMAALYNFYKPDFIGLQEVADATQVNGTDCFDGVKTMQSVLMSYMNTNYKYVDFSAQLNGNSHFTPIIYDSSKWTPVAQDYDTTKECLLVACTMHRWQWALFESVDNPAYKVIVVNIHGPHNGTYHGPTVKDAFFQDLNTQLKSLEAQYENVPIFVTGDYNVNPETDETNAAYIATMTNGTSLTIESELTTNCEPSNFGGIDHIFMSAGDGTVKQFREAYNLTSVKLSTDHAPVYMDVELKRIVVSTPGSSMDWNAGTILP
ncbi:MAG: hypothetical protein IJD64_05415 [Clostridia bacterium]|nr:hypothetical protein [Clostridia bacterium]